MSRLLLCGAFGQGNPGDEALLAACAGALRDHDLWVTTAAADADAPAGLEPIAPTASAVGRALQDVDGVVVAGGTVFKMLHPSTQRHPLGLLTRTALLQLAASARGIPFVLAGVGAGPLRGRVARRVSRVIADRADLLVLRDEESATVLKDAAATGPFRVGADLTWTLLGHPSLTPRPHASSSSGDDGILVVLSHHARADQSELARGVATIVDRLHERDIPVHLQPWQGGRGSADDRLVAMVCDAARSGADASVLRPPADLFEAVVQAGSMRAVVGYRFHALVAAAAAGRPFLAVSHEPKLSGLARRLRQSAVPPHAPPPVLRAVVDDLLEQAAPSPVLIDREVELAGATLDLVRVVVTRGADDELLDHRRTELSGGVPW